MIEIILNRLIHFGNFISENTNKRLKNVFFLPDPKFYLFLTFSVMLSDKVCTNCHQSFATNEHIVNAAGHIWHTHCFVYVS